MSFAHYLQYLLIRFFFTSLRCLPRIWRGAFGAALGQLTYFIGIRRKVTIDNLHLAFPQMPERALRTVARRVYRHFGRVAISFSTLPRLSADALGKWMFVTNKEVLTDALSEGKGAIVVSGHLGNWELMGAIVAAIGLPVTFVVTTQRNKRVERMMDKYRESVGVEIVKRRVAVKGVISALKRNRLVAILIDQDAHEDGAFVPFFGRLASTPRGPAVFHARTGVPLIFARSTRLPGERYRVDIERLDTGGITDIDQITAIATAKLEAAIRETPEQWFWMHRRWKTAPEKS